jgi:hypothetical protein
MMPVGITVRFCEADDASGNYCHLLWEMSLLEGQGIL